VLSVIGLGLSGCPCAPYVLWYNVLVIEGRHVDPVVWALRHRPKLLLGLFV
jgi:hypothetical protein